MRLHKTQISKLADHIIEILTVKNQFVEVATRTEEELQVKDEARHSSEPLPPTKIDELHRAVRSVLYNYLNTDQRLHQAAREEIDRRGEDNTELYTVKRKLAKREGFGLGEEAPVYIIEQLIESLLHSSSVAEVFADDLELRMALLPTLSEAMASRRNLQQEMNARLRKIEKSSESWEELYFAVNQRLREHYNID